MTTVSGSYQRKRNNAAVEQAKNLLLGHHLFLQTNTGETNNPVADLFAINDESVMSNNRHFIAYMQQEALPNGDATTESQSLLIQGYIHAYMATGNQLFLTWAINYWEAYVKYFYNGQAIPSTPAPWTSNWICNGKQPVLAHYPMDTVNPTHSGFKDVTMTFNNGQTQIPHGAPYYGEWLDVVGNVYDGGVTYGAINASITALNSDGSLKWGTPGVVYPIAWMIGWDGNQVDADGNILNTGLPQAEYGTIQLVDQTISGPHRVSFAPRLPVANGGYMIGRNEVYTNRPVQASVANNVSNMGNSSDSEQWFMDTCYILWKLTGNQKFYNAYMSSKLTIWQYSNIDSTDKFFRQTTAATTPFTDGISYDFQYPSTLTVTYGRDASGYVTLDMNESGQEALEQQSVWFRINAASIVETTFGGVGTVTSAPVTAAVQVLISPTKSATDPNALLYGTNMPPSIALAPVATQVPLSAFVRLLHNDGVTPYQMADTRAVTNFGTCTYQAVYATGILGSRETTVVTATFPDSTAGFIIGFWLLASNKSSLNSITYQADTTFDLKILDDNNWYWYWTLPATGTGWVTEQLLPSQLILANYQPYQNGRQLPTTPVYSQLPQFQIQLDNANDTNKHFSYYCVNDVPPVFNGSDGYTIKYRITLNCTEAYNAKLGDCTMLNYRTDSLYCTPGVIPFGNGFNLNTNQIGAWRGEPYPGYQYPLVWSLESDSSKDLQLNNVSQFLYASQTWYQQQFGVLGPGAAAYIWNRWDNTIYGPADTWTMYDFGTVPAWAGYQPRAYFGACRAWYELQLQGKPIPPSLEQYVVNWANFLVSYMKQNNASPTEFPPNAPPSFVPNDFTGHMTGLWLAGSCYAAFAGLKVPDLDYLIEALFHELQKNYVVVQPPNHPMNGAWSPYVSPSTTGNSMFFGFWAGEIMRGLGMYIMYKQHPPGTNIYELQPQQTVTVTG